MHLRFSAVIYHISEPQVLGSVGGWEGRTKPHMPWLHVLVSVGQIPAPVCEQTEWRLNFPKPSGKGAVVTLSQWQHCQLPVCTPPFPFYINSCHCFFQGNSIKLSYFYFWGSFSVPLLSSVPFISYVLFKMEFIIKQLVLEVKKCNTFQKLLFHCWYYVNGTCSKFSCRWVVKSEIPSYSCANSFPFIVTVFWVFFYFPLE